MQIYAGFGETFPADGMWKIPPLMSGGEKSRDEMFTGKLFATGRRRIYSYEIKSQKSSREYDLHFRDFPF